MAWCSEVRCHALPTTANATVAGLDSNCLAGSAPWDVDIRPVLLDRRLVGDVIPGRPRLIRCDAVHD